MKRTNQMSILLLMAYCIPFAYLCVMGDGKWGTMLFYGVMIAGFSLLCWGAVKTGRRTIIFIGNLCSLLSSCAAAVLTDMEPMGHYFKPFTAFTLMILLSVLALIFQIIPAFLITKGRHTADQPPAE